MSMGGKNDEVETSNRCLANRTTEHVYKWRGATKFVAYSKLTESIVGLILIVGIIAIVFVGHIPIEEATFPWKIIVGFLLLLLFIVTVDFWLFILLLTSVKKETETKAAWMKARTWFRVEMACFIISMGVGIVGQMDSNIIMTFAAGRGGSFFIVYKYINELKGAVKQGETQDFLA